MKHPITGPVVRVEVVHLGPAMGYGTTPCCGKTPFELPLTDRMTYDHTLVTCRPQPDPAADGEHVHVCATCAQVWNGERWVQA